MSIGPPFHFVFWMVYYAVVQLVCILLYVIVVAEHQSGNPRYHYHGAGIARPCSWYVLF